MPPTELLWLLAAALFATVACALALVAWSGESTANIIHATPTLTARDVLARHQAALSGMRPFGEPIELVGTIESDEELLAPESHTRCVAYEYTLSEDRSRQDGRMHRRSGSIHESSAFENYSRRVQRCYVADSTGRTAIDLTHARLELVELIARYEEYSGLQGSSREIWREEWALPIGRQVYVLGYLTNADAAPLVARHPLDPEQPFLVSHRDERTILGRTRRRAYLLYLSAGLCSGFAALSLLFGLGVLNVRL
jgi:hypothetical protein